MNECPREAILNELVEKLGLLAVRPYEITAADLAEKSGLSVDGARRALNRQVSEGGWRRGYRRQGQQRVIAFWRVEDEEGAVEWPSKEEVI